MDDSDRRTAALARLEAKREFRTHVAVYLIVNAMLVAETTIGRDGHTLHALPTDRTLEILDRHSRLGR